MAAEGRPRMPERRLERAREPQLIGALQAPPEAPRAKDRAKCKRPEGRTRGRWPSTGPSPRRVSYISARSPIIMWDQARRALIEELTKPWPLSWIA